MLAGLLFAIERAVDDPTTLLATLPFAGGTLIEYQARQLVSAGVGQIVVVADGPRTELVGAIHRIARAGISLDVASHAAAAAAVVHPLARVVMLADGLVTTDAMVKLLAREEGEALIVVPADGAPSTFERVGGAGAWAGAARLDAGRLVELAELPPDYDPQSTLLRLVEAGGAVRLPLPHIAGALHGIERSAASLTLVERRIVAAAVDGGSDWFGRFVTGPLLRLAMPLLAARGVRTVLAAAVAGLLAIGGMAAVAVDRSGGGLVLVLAAMLAAAVAEGLATVRQERAVARGLHAGSLGLAAATGILLAWRCVATTGDGAAWPVAVALIVAAAMTERSGAAPARWWGGAASCIFIVAVATLVGWPVAGLTLAALYATAMLAAAIEALSLGLAPL